MSNKRFWWSVLSVWIVMNVTNYFIHEVWLSSLYQQTAQFWRSAEAIQHWAWMMWVGSLVWSWAFVWIYSKGISTSNPWGQAFRYAWGIILLSQIPQWAMTWVVSPYPAELVIKWAFVGAIQAMLCAYVMTWTFKPQLSWSTKTSNQ